MGTGYTRQDTSNNIADGKTIEAADIDAEFDALRDAFDESTGHTHDGTADEGAPITVVGPNQEYVSSITAFAPKTDDTYDLGTSSLQWQDLYINGTANIDNLVADGTVNFNGATVSNLGTVTTANIDGGTIDGTTIGGSSAAAATVTDLTASGTVSFSGATVSDLGTVTTADIDGGSIDGTAIGANSESTGAFTTLTASTSATFADNVFSLQDNADTSKVLNFELSGITTATTRTLTVPDANTTIVGTDTTQTLTNKTIDAANNTLSLTTDSVDAITEIASSIKSGADGTLITGTAGTSGDLSQWNADGDLVDGPTPPSGTIVGTTDTQTLTNKTLTAPTITGLDIDDNQFTISDNADGSKQVAFEVSGVTTATTRTLTVPDASTTIVGTDTTQTLTNKTIDSASNTLTVDLSEATVTGTAAEFNTAVSDDTFLLTSNNLSDVSNNYTALENLGVLESEDAGSFNTGLLIPSGTTAQRASSPDGTQIRYNSTDGQFEGYNGSSWGSIGGAGLFRGENGETGDVANGAGDIFRGHEQTLNTDTTLTSGNNWGAFGDLTVASGVTLTVESGAKLTVV